ncbi:MAG: PKD domain-containing protein [Acidobacteria bacterium]|nr:PKD domain-containing protein [Acidobacteriota bacterium]
MYTSETVRLRRLLTWSLVGLAGALTAATCAHAAGLVTSVQLTAEARGGLPAKPNPSSICLGEVLEVVVSAQHPVDPAVRVSVAVNGLPGERRFLQFFGEPGPRRIHIAAQSEDGLVDGASQVLDVGPCEVTEIPRVFSRQNPYRPGRVDFHLDHLEGLGPDFTGFYWDFGDGEGTYSDQAYVTHDYRQSLDGTSPYRTFLVQLATQPFVNGQAPAGSLVRRATASAGDSYFFAKERGFLLPPVDHEPVLEHRGDQLVGFYSLRNLENEHIIFQHVTQETFACDPARSGRRDTRLPADVIFQGGVDLEDPDFVESPSYQLSLQIRDDLYWLPEDTQVIPPAYDPDHPPAWWGGKSTGGGNLSQVHARGTSVTGPVFPPIPPPTGSGSGYVVLPGGHTHEGFLTLQASDFDPSECNVAFHLVGETTKGQRVYASLYYELRENPSLSGAVKDKFPAQFLSVLLDRGWIPDPTEIKDEDLYRLEQEGKIRRTPAGWEVI